MTVTAASNWPPKKNGNEPVSGRAHRRHDDDGDAGGQPQERPHGPARIRLLPPRRDPREGDQTDALGDEVREVREREPDDVEAESRRREEQRQHHLVRAKHVDGGEAGQEPPQPEGDQEPAAHGGARGATGASDPADERRASAHPECREECPDDGDDRVISDHEESGDADRVEGPGEQAQPVEEAKAQMSLEQAQAVLLGEHRRREAEGEPAGGPNLGRVPVQDQQEPERLEDR